jgi:N-formylmaleamate deformylase
MPDARGHGNSSTPFKGYRYEDHASDVVGLIKGLGLVTPVLLGHSMGGMTAAVIASPRAARHPNRSSELIELLAEARLQTRLHAFDVLTPPNPEYRGLVSTIRVPIQLVIGDNGVVSLETARELQKLNPRLRVEQIQDSGHGLPYDQPDRFAAVVTSFLRSMAAL